MQMQLRGSLVSGVLLCATQVVQPVQPAVACGCVRLRAVACGWYGVGTIRLRLVIVRLYGGL